MQTLEKIQDITGLTLKKCGKGWKARAIWRGDKEPSLSIFPGSDGELFYRDHATGETGHITQILTRHYGMTLQQAKAALGLDNAAYVPQVKKEAPELVPVKLPQPRENQEYVGVPDHIRALFHAKLQRLPDELARRGFGEDVLGMFPFAIYQKGLAFPIIGPNGEWRQVKVRLSGNAARYRYAVTGGGAPALYLGPKEAPSVMIVEGELNALAYHYMFTLKGAHIRVIGLPGASYVLTKEDVEQLRGKAIWIDTDADVPGRKLRDDLNYIIQTTCEDAVVYIYNEDNLHRDACELLACQGVDGFWETFMKRAKDVKRRGSHAKRVNEKIASYVKGIDNKREVYRLLGTWVSWAANYLPVWAYSAEAIVRSMGVKVIGHDNRRLLRLVAALNMAGGMAPSLNALERMGAIGNKHEHDKWAIKKAVELGLIEEIPNKRKGSAGYRLKAGWLKRLKAHVKRYEQQHREEIEKRAAFVRNQRHSFWQKFYEFARRFSAWVRANVLARGLTPPAPPPFKPEVVRPPSPPSIRPALV